VRIRRSAVVPLAAALAFATACSRGADQAAFTPPPAEVAVVEVTPRDVALPYEFTSRVEGSREVEIRARVSGILLRRAYDEGAPVRKGQLLFEIDPAPYRAEVQAARAVLAETEARRARAERETARLEPLLAERAVSQKAFDDAVSEAEQARAGVLLAQARLDRAEVDLAYTRVTAPIAGLSSRAVHSEGSLVEPGDDGLLTRLSQVEPIWIRFSVPDKTLLELRRGIAEGRIASPAPSELEVEIVLADGSLHPERGRVNFADSRIDAATGAVDLRAELPNAGATLVPGQFVRTRLLGVTRPGTIVVPQRAVLQGQQGKFVYVVAAGDAVELRPVEVGGWVGDDWIVESGLAAGDRVVVDGTSKVRPGAQVTVAAAPAAAPES
jgi:membrane fusion protein (multidrug efflux system)